MCQSFIQQYSQWDGGRVRNLLLDPTRHGLVLTDSETQGAVHLTVMKYVRVS